MFNYIRDKVKIFVYSHVNKKFYPLILKRMYKKLVGEELDFNNLETYTQKIQWLKLYDCNKVKAELSDKYAVREWVKNKIGDEYLIPLVAGPFYDANDIDFSKLPNKFVIKANHGSSFNMIVRDKNKLDIKKTKKILNRWLKIRYAFKSGLELHYDLIKPCLIIEKYMENKDGSLNDYKFLCFSGKPYYVWQDFDRFFNHTRNMYDIEWNLQPFTRSTYNGAYESYNSPVPKPVNYDKMVDIVKELCKDFEYVRVDLYNINGKIYFGEMTFTDGSGFGKMSPDEYNYKLGALIDIEKIKKNQKKRK